MPEALKPCPFCGGAEIVSMHINYSWWAIRCRACGAEGGKVRIPMEATVPECAASMGELERLWNRRAPAVQHWSDCATSNGPAYPVGPCDCGATPTQAGAGAQEPAP